MNRKKSLFIEGKTRALCICVYLRLYRVLMCCLSRVGVYICILSVRFHCVCVSACANRAALHTRCKNINV